MYKGLIKFYIVDKGYGFITTEKGEDLFFHHSAVVMKNNIKGGDPVQFDIRQGRTGKPEAHNIIVIKQ